MRELIALSDKATQGRWRAESQANGDKYFWNSGGIISAIDGKEHWVVITGPDGDIPHEADKEFIVAAVNFVRDYLESME